MLDRARLILIALLPAFWSGAAQATERCPPSDEAGWVAEIRTLSPGRVGDWPGVSGRRGRVLLAESDPLCANELVDNPAGSRRLLTLRLAGGGRETIVPGRSYVVPAPSFFSGATDALNRLLGRNSASSRAASAAVGAYVRGGPECAYEPSEAPHETAFAVPEWGRIRISWPCPDDSNEGWIATLSSPGRASTPSRVGTNFMQINAASCTPRCVLSVTRSSGGNPVMVLTIETRDPASMSLPADLARITFPPLRQAAIGAWLVDNADPRWRLQGFSLLYEHGCDVPAAGRLAAGYFGSLRRGSADQPGSPTPLRSPEETCLGVASD